MSVVQICNIGLSRYLGYQRINNLSEGTPGAEQCELHYNDLRKGLLEDHWWFFATKVQALAETTNDRPNQWAYKYALPSDAIEIHWVNDPTVAAAARAVGRNPDAPRETVGAFVYSNVPVAYVEFTADVTNTDTMPQYFKDALSARLAAAVALTLTESVSRARFAGEQAEVQLDKAIAKDEQNLPPLKMPQADYLSDRMGIYGSTDFSEGR